MKRKNLPPGPQDKSNHQRGRCFPDFRPDDEVWKVGCVLKKCRIWNEPATKSCIFTFQRPPEFSGRPWLCQRLWWLSSRATQYGRCVEGITLSGKHWEQIIFSQVLPVSHPFPIKKPSQFRLPDAISNQMARRDRIRLVGRLFILQALVDVIAILRALIKGAIQIQRFHVGQVHFQIWLMLEKKHNGLL